MKDLIIGCSTNYQWSTIKYWVNSINKSGFKGDKILIFLSVDEATLKKVHEAGFMTLVIGDKTGTNLPVHVERFLHIYNILRQNHYRYVITTDVKDVVFQKNPIDFIEKNIGDKKLIFASESLLYKDEPWGNQNLLETFGPFFHSIFKENLIYNVGVLAGRGQDICDLACMIFNMSINRPIPIVDQSTFNLMISMAPYTHTSLYLNSEDAWACQLGTTADPSKIAEFAPKLLEPTPVLAGDTVTTSTGLEYTIVHQYDRVPEWRKIIEEKYG